MAYLCEFKYPYVHVCIRSTYIYTCTCISTVAYIVNIYTCACAHIRVSIHIFVYVCIYTHISHVAYIHIRIHEEIFPPAQDRHSKEAEPCADRLLDACGPLEGRSRTLSSLSCSPPLHNLTEGGTGTVDGCRTLKDRAGWQCWRVTRLNMLQMRPS